MLDPSNISQIQIVSSSKTYAVEIGSDLLDSLQADSNSFVLTDARFAPRIRELGFSNLIEVVAIEDNKNLATVEQIMVNLQNMGLRRGHLVTAVGGGIIQDLATITASLYMRGVDWCYFPTTLLGMADSCIGGKSSINAGNVKNLVGNIFPPNKISIDTNFLSTLSDVDISAGLTEAVKICFCRGNDVFKKYLDLVSDAETIDFAALLTHVLQTKKWFIEIDEFDKNERQLLNFGHTFGHALEVAGKHKIPHGIAVAVGMKSALEFEKVDRDLSISENQLMSYILDLLMAAGIDYDFNKLLNWDLFKSAFEGDKKHQVDHYQLVLPNEGGGVRLQAIPKNKESFDKISKSLKRALEGITQ